MKLDKNLLPDLLENTEIWNTPTFPEMFCIAVWKNLLRKGGGDGIETMVFKKAKIIKSSVKSTPSCSRWQPFKPSITSYNWQITQKSHKKFCSESSLIIGFASILEDRKILLFHLSSFPGIDIAPKLCWKFSFEND